MIYKHNIVRCVRVIQGLSQTSAALAVGQIRYEEIQDEIDWCYVALFAMLNDAEKQFAMQGEVIEVLMFHECKTGTVTGTACACCTRIQEEINKRCLDE